MTIKFSKKGIFISKYKALIYNVLCGSHEQNINNHSLQSKRISVGIR